MGKTSASLGPLRVAPAMVGWTIGVRARALGLAVAMALGVGPAPAAADSAAMGAVLGSFPTKGAAWASWTPIRNGIDIGLPMAMACALDGITDGPARLVLPAEDAAGARKLCRAIRAAGRSCRPMVAPCSSEGRVLDAAPEATSRPPAAWSTVAPPTPPTPPEPDGPAATLGAWAALAQDLSSWPGGAALASGSAVDQAAPRRAASVDAGVSSSMVDAAFGEAQASAGVVDEATLVAATRALRAGDHAAAARLLTPRAQAGDPVAAHNLAILVSHGLGMPRDDRVAARWMTVAAEAGLISAQNTLALMYLHGRGVERDRRAAVRWLAEAARGGHPLARANLLQVMRTSLALSSQSDAAATTGDGISAVSAATGGRDAPFAGVMP